MAALEVTVRVAARTVAADSVVLFDLVANKGADLGPWTPGSHIDVLLPRGGERQYSLIPAEPGIWRIGVLRESDGRGGSAWLHDEVEVGRTMRVRSPQNHFAFEPPAGAPVVFLAAGIGITALTSMIAEARTAGIEHSVHYSAHTRSSMALLDEVADATLHISDEGTRLDVATVLPQLDPAAVLYCCGPTRFIEAVEAAAGGHALHVERFEAKSFGAPVWEGEFEVELAASGETLVVPPDRSILEVVEEAGIFVLSSCREGTCGTCETELLEGEVEHRDSILTPDQQEANTVMYICVSRAACPRLVLEL